MILATVSDRVARAGRQAALGMVGGLCMLAGLGFLTLAAWIAMAAQHGALVAALVLGLGYAGLALVLLALAARRPPRQPRPAGATADPHPDRGGDMDRDAMLRAVFAGAGLKVPPRGEFPPLVEAFMFGLTAALTLRDRPQAARAGRDDPPAH